MIQGNSGGPVVDDKGRLLGVVVSRLTGENVGFAVPPSAIASFLAGDVDKVEGGVEAWTGTSAKVQVVGRLVDPFGKIKSMAVRYVRQPTAAIPLKTDAQGNWPLLTGGQEVPMSIKDGSGYAQFNLQAANPDDRKLLVQVVMRDSFRAGDREQADAAGPARQADRSVRGVSAGYTAPNPGPLVVARPIWAKASR